MRRDSRTSFVFERGSCTLGSSAYITSETQRIEPTSVCELDAGIPKYHVQKFQIIAAIRSERTTHTPNAIDS